MTQLFNLEKVIRGEMPMKDCWIVGVPCKNGHQVDGLNIRNSESRGCVQCTIDVSKARLAKAARDNPKEVKFCEGCGKANVRSRLCFKCKRKSDDAKGQDIDREYHYSTEWDCFMADVWLKHPWGMGQNRPESAHKAFYWARNTMGRLEVLGGLERV